MKSSAEVTAELDLARLGLNLGQDDATRPMFDRDGRQLRGLPAVKGIGQEGSLPLTALQAIAVATMAATTGQKPTTKPAASRNKPKVARSFEVSVSNQEAQGGAAPLALSPTEQMNSWARGDNQQTHDTTPGDEYPQQYGGGPYGGYYGGRGNYAGRGDFGGRGYYGGRGAFGG